jgi:hypothetical protein
VRVRSNVALNKRENIYRIYPYLLNIVFTGYVSRVLF